MSPGSNEAGDPALPRCFWADPSRSSAAMVGYHDSEWGVPSRDEVHLFELLVLESAQSGLSWATVLGKRAGYWEAFVGFDAEKVAEFSPEHVEALLRDGRIIRNRAKVTSTVANAVAIASMHERGESLSDLIWSVVDGVPVVNRWEAVGELPAQTPQSVELAARLKRAGLRFVGPTTCYSLMQAAGLVNDHLMTCYRWAELQGGSPGAAQRARRGGAGSSG